MLSLTMTALLLPMTSFAQSSDDFFRVGDEFNGNRDVLTYSLTGSLANDDFGTPLGSGLLILTAVGAGYAIARRKRSFRKGTTLMLAALLLLGMTDCKKKAADPIVPASVKITLNVSGDNDGSKVVVNPPHVTFENGDKVLVGYNSKYVGTLTHDGTNFSGSISAEKAGSQPLYFYFVGNKDTGTLTEGTTTSCTVNISDQSTELPVLSYSQSTENFTGAGTYYASLHNQCGLVKFTLAKAAGSVQVGGMHTEATINFETPAITPTATTGSVSLNSKSKTEKWAILLPQDAVDAAAVTVGSENLTVDVPAITRNAYITDIPAIANTQIDISQLSDNYEAQNGEILYGTLGGNYKITIAADATVTLNSVTINGTNNSSYAWAGLTCLGDATIILKDGTTNNVKGFHEDYPGIYVPAGSTLIIKGETFGTGILNASSNDDTNNSGAGIGGGWSMACGNIEIQGGVINATGSTCAAGIGSNNQACGNITISGGTVTATGGGNAAGIGSGFGGGCGDITIASTVTRVTATKGDGADHSIGRGRTGSCGTVTIGGVEGAISTSPYTYPAPVAPSGAINGLFSVSSTKQVYFSKGNLQYQASTGTWRFAEHQYDFIGGGNFLSESNTEWIDLYRWGTSGINYTGHATLYRPWEWAYYSQFFNPYGSLTTNLYDGDGENAGKADWGYNAISNGGNTQNSGWRTLKNNTTNNEWQYIFNSRTTANEINSTSNARYTQARININDWAVRGIILFPDGSIGDTPSGVTWGTINAAASNWTTGTTQCTTAGWAALEAAGCVFLPAAGKYDDSGVSQAEINGYYWSSSYASDDNAYGMYFYSNEVNPQYSDARHYGLSVRLVQDAY